MTIYLRLSAGQYLEVVFAKPQSEKKPDAANLHHAAPVPNYIPHTVYGGFAANPYGAAPAYGVNPSLQQVFNVSILSSSFSDAKFLDLMKCILSNSQ